MLIHIQHFNTNVHIKQGQSTSDNSFLTNIVYSGTKSGGTGLKPCLSSRHSKLTVDHDIIAHSLTLKFYQVQGTATAAELTLDRTLRSRSDLR